MGYIGFEDIEEELANKLRDDDIYAILKCINARDVLKELKLTGCFSIEGHGLHPLRGSSTLDIIDVSIIKQDEMIDVSIAKQDEEPDNNPQPRMHFDEVVLPILYNIDSHIMCIHQTTKQPSLKHIQGYSNKSILFL